MSSEPIFSPQTFALLEGLRRDPTVFYYRAHKAELKEWVEQPLHNLMFGAARRLPTMMRNRLETQRNLFSRFLKNDFGQGGAWDNHWGAFYPKGSRRIMDVQLAIWLDRERLSISFYISDYAKAQRERFARNCGRYRDLLPGWLGGLTTCERAVGALAQRGLSWEAWLDDPARGDFWVHVPFSPQEAMAMPGQELEDWVVKVHGAYFPLALLAMEEAPLQLIQVYLGG